jgi:hypothetical protein
MNMSTSNKEVKTSFTFQLGKEKNKNLSAEIDTRSFEDGGDNAARLGKTSGFEPGETIGFLVYVTPNVTIDYIRTTMDDVGARVVYAGKRVVKIMETVKFEELTSTPTLSKPTTQESLDSSISTNQLEKTSWIGNDLGYVTVGNDGITLKLGTPSVKLNPSDDEDTRFEKLKTLRKPGLLKAFYTTEALLYQLETPFETPAITFGFPPYDCEVFIYATQN